MKLGPTHLAPRCKTLKNCQKYSNSIFSLETLVCKYLVDIGTKPMTVIYTSGGFLFKTVGGHWRRWRENRQKPYAQNRLTAYTAYIWKNVETKPIAKNHWFLNFEFYGGLITW